MIARGKAVTVGTILIGCYVSFFICGDTLKSFGNQLSSGLALSPGQAEKNQRCLTPYIIYSLHPEDSHLSFEFLCQG